MAQPVLSLRNGQIDLGGKPLLSRLNLQLETGQAGVLLGKTGSGKTSLLRTIAGLHPLAAGRLDICGCPAVQPTHRRGIGLAPQLPQLLAGKSASDNIALGLKGGRRRIKQRVTAILQALNIGHLARSRPAQLSGGEAKLVCIGQALAPGQPLVLLDEPSAGLDAQRRQQLPDQVRSIAGQQTTLLVTTHDAGEAFLWADRLGVIADGRLLLWLDALSVWRNPRRADVAVATALGDLLQAQAAGEGSRSRIVTAAGAVRLSGHSAASGPCIVLVRPGGLQLARDGAANATVVRFEIRGGIAGLRVRLTASGEQCWARCPLPLDSRLPTAGAAVCVRLSEESLSLL